MILGGGKKNSPRLWLRSAEGDFAHFCDENAIEWNEEEVKRMSLAMAIGLLIWEGKLRIESLFQS